MNEESLKLEYEGDHGSSLDILLQMYKAKKKILAPYNFGFKGDFERIIYLYIQQGDYEKAYKYLGKILTAMKEVWYKHMEDSLLPITGVFLFMGGKLAGQIGKMKEAVYLLTEAEKIVTYTQKDDEAFMMDFKENLLGAREALMNSERGSQ